MNGQLLDSQLKPKGRPRKSPEPSHNVTHVMSERIRPTSVTGASKTQASAVVSQLKSLKYPEGGRVNTNSIDMRKNNPNAIKFPVSCILKGDDFGKGELLHPPRGSEDTARKSNQEENHPPFLKGKVENRYEERKSNIDENSSSVRNSSGSKVSFYNRITNERSFQQEDRPITSTTNHNRCGRNAHDIKKMIGGKTGRNEMPKQHSVAFISKPREQEGFDGNRVR